MGAGKSTIGRELARILSYTFVDLDSVIEESERMSIREIFEQKGERYFRKIELDTLEGFAGSPASVISLGGGAPCGDKNINLINSLGLSIYLKLTPPQLTDRLESQRDARPLLKHIKTVEELTSFITDKLNEREVFYSRASLIVEAEKSVASVTNDIIYKLKRHEVREEE